MSIWKKYPDNLPLKQGFYIVIHHEEPLTESSIDEFYWDGKEWLVYGPDNVKYFAEVPKEKILTDKKITYEKLLKFLHYLELKLYEYISSLNKNKELKGIIFELYNDVNNIEIYINEEKFKNYKFIEIK